MIHSIRPPPPRPLFCWGGKPSVPNFVKGGVLKSPCHRYLSGGGGGGFVCLLSKSTEGFLSGWGDLLSFLVLGGTEKITWL